MNKTLAERNILNSIAKSVLELSNRADLTIVEFLNWFFSREPWKYDFTPLRYSYFLKRWNEGKLPEIDNQDDLEDLQSMTVLAYKKDLAYLIDRMKEYRNYEKKHYPKRERKIFGHPHSASIPEKDYLLLLLTGQLRNQLRDVFIITIPKETAGYTVGMLLTTLLENEGSESDFTETCINQLREDIFKAANEIKSILDSIVIDIDTLKIIEK